MLNDEEAVVRESGEGIYVREEKRKARTDSSQGRISFEEERKEKVEKKLLEESG